MDIEETGDLRMADERVMTICDNVRTVVKNMVIMKSLR